jgi:hypothetical protein
MSSILNALNKIDNEKKSDVNRFTPGLPLDTEKILSNRIKTRKRAGVWGFILVLMITIGVWAMNYKGIITARKSPASLSVVEKGAKETATQSNQSDMTGTLQSPETVVTPKREAVDEQPQVSKVPDIKEESRVETESADIPVPKSRPATVSLPDTVADSEDFKEATADYPLADQERFKLQAISWSTNPEARIAVINSDLVKEGQSILQVTIHRINENSVILEEHGEFSELFFE